MLTVSQAHIKHNLIVVVDGSWLLSLPLLVQSNKKLAQLGSIVKMLSNRQGYPNWTWPWLATTWLMGSATLALHIKRALRDP
jgi:predicted YcjX-like family ATPase